MILQPWHPPYYQRADRGRGLRQGDGPADVGAAVRRASRRASSSTPRSTPPPRRRCARKGSTIRNMRKRDLADEVRRFMEVYNEAWGDNWGFVPLTDAEVEFQAKNLKQVIDEDWAFMAEKDGEVVGAALTLPDINQVLAKMNGRLLPFGWLTLPARQAQDRPGAASSRSASSTTYRHTGVAAGLYLKHLEAASPDGDRRRRDGLDPGDERADEPGDGRHGRQDRQALPDLREGAVRSSQLARFRTRALPNSAARIATVGRVSARNDLSEIEVRARSSPRRTSRPGPSSRSAPLEAYRSRRLAGPAHRGPHRRARRRRRRARRGGDGRRGEGGRRRRPPAARARAVCAVARRSARPTSSPAAPSWSTSTCSVGERGRPVGRSRSRSRRPRRSGCRASAARTG